MNAKKLKKIFEASNDKYADAKAIGTTYQTMYNIIYKNSICKVDLLEKIANFYKVPVGFFFDEDNENENGNVNVNSNNHIKGNKNIVDIGNKLVYDDVKTLQNKLDKKDELIDKLSNRIVELSCKLENKSK
ncbi:MAG: helix-turn-helix transcriptional regulator [Paludibacter sp.]|nr:helix-turn-helix transcriptional regulator [Paludibacter sp.]